jgi:hypothetical protein
MGIGASLVLITVGAVLRWGVTVDAEGVNLDTIGVILLIVGAVGLLLSLAFWSSWGGWGPWRGPGPVAPPAGPEVDRTTVYHDRY